MRPSLRGATAGLAVATAIGLGSGGGAIADGPAVTLDAPVRIQTPGGSVSNCPVEGEPTITVTSAGTWVAYNDDRGCPLSPVAALRLTSLQLIPPGGVPVYVSGLQAPPGDALNGDPALTPDPQNPGGVILATLESTSVGLQVEAYRVSPVLQVTRLPSPSLKGSDDKEFIASDTSPASPYRGHTYIAWDDLLATQVTTFRAFDGTTWAKPVPIAPASGAPDVAVAANGVIAVAYRDPSGSMVRMSMDGGKTFTPPALALSGTDAGRADPACPLRSVVGQRQRVFAEPRVAFDSNNVLHIVAPLQPAVVSLPGVGPEGQVGLGTGGAGSIMHTTTRDGVVFTPPTAVAAPGSDVQFMPAVAAVPTGGVAVEWLQTSGTGETAYGAFMALAPAGGVDFGTPIQLSTGASTFPPAMEALGNSECYGIGDYSGLATTASGVVAVWPTTDGAATPLLDSDVMLRAAEIGTPAAPGGAPQPAAAPRAGSPLPAIAVTGRRGSRLPEL